MNWLSIIWDFCCLWYAPAALLMRFEEERGKMMKKRSRWGIDEEHTDLPAQGWCSGMPLGNECIKKETLNSLSLWAFAHKLHQGEPSTWITFHRYLTINNCPCIVQSKGCGRGAERARTWYFNKSCWERAQRVFWAQEATSVLHQCNIDNT